MKFVLGLVVAVWVLIGGMAADQRGDFAYGSLTCASVGEISLTVAAGPLNYQGVNPEVACTLPTPSV